MKKLLICLLALLGLLVLLCGCTESEIACGVDAENRAFLRYDWELDLTKLSVREQIPILNWLKERAAALQAQGFTVEHNAVTANQNGNWLRAELVRQGKDRNEALELLREMLSDESLSPFTAAAVELLPQELQDAGRVSVRLEPERVLATVGVETWPKRLREQVGEWLASGGITVTLSLPATALPAGEEAALEDGLAVKRLRVPLNGSGELSLSALYYTGGGEVDQLWWLGKSRSAADGEALVQSVETDAAALHRLEKLLLIAAVVLAALAVLLFAVGTLRRKRRLAAQPAPDEASVGAVIGRPPEAETSDEASEVRHQASGDEGTDPSTPLRSAQDDDPVGAVIGRPPEAEASDPAPDPDVAEAPADEKIES